MAFPRGFSLRNADGTFVTKEVAMMRLKNLTQEHPTLAFAVPEKPKVPTSAESTVSQHNAANGIEKPTSSVPIMTPAPKSNPAKKPKANSTNTSKKSPPQRKLQPDETIDHKGRVRYSCPTNWPFRR